MVLHQARRSATGVSKLKYCGTLPWRTVGFDVKTNIIRSIVDDVVMSIRLFSQHGGAVLWPCPCLNRLLFSNNSCSGLTGVLLVTKSKCCCMLCVIRKLWAHWIMRFVHVTSLISQRSIRSWPRELYSRCVCVQFITWRWFALILTVYSPLELHLTTSELWFGQEQEGILP